MNATMSAGINIYTKKMENNVIEAIQEKISSQNKEKMLSFRKVADRVSEDS